MNVFDLFAKLSLDKSEYEEGLDDAQKDAEGFGSKLKSGLGTAGKVAGGAIAAVGTASVALGKAFVDGMGDVASYGDSIDKMSQKIGISAEAYQEWDFIAQHSGTSMESLKASFKTLSTAAQNGTEEFEALGISLEDAASMSTEDLFSSVISGLQNMEEGTERTALASKLLGRGAIELGALLNTSAEDTEAMRQQVHDLGGVMSNEAVKSAAQYQDSLQNMQTALTGLKNNMMSEFLPAASQVMDGLAKVFSGDESGLGSIDEGIDNMISKITESLPKLMEVGGKIVESLSKSIISNLPKMAKTAGDIILTLASDLIKQLPALIESGMQIIMELALAIGEALPDLIPTIVEVILEIVDTLIDNIDMLVEGAIAIILGLAEGLIKALPILIDKLPEIITSIVDALITNIPLLVDGAIQLVTLLVTHLPEIIMGLIQAIPTIITAIIEAFAPLVSDLGQVASDAIASIIKWFSELPGKLAYWAGVAVASVIKFFIDLPKNIKEIFTKVVAKVKEFGSNLKENAKTAGKNFFNGLVDTIKNLPEKIKDIGRNIVEGLKNGIKEKWDAMVQWFEDLGSKFIDGFKGVFGIHSPSTVFKKLGGYMTEGLKIGWDDGFEDLQKDLKNVKLNMNVEGGVTSGGTRISGVANNEPQRYVIENHIHLEGEAKGVWKLVKNYNDVNTKITNKNELATT